MRGREVRHEEGGVHEVAVPLLSLTFFPTLRAMSSSLVSPLLLPRCTNARLYV